MQIIGLYKNPLIIGVNEYILEFLHEFYIYLTYL